MRKTIIFIITLLFVNGCSLGSINAKNNEKEEKYAPVEITLSDFSKKLIANYLRSNQSFPKDFDEKQFISELEKIYPDKGKVRFIKENFTIKVRSLNDGYSVALCDSETNNKLMEDIANLQCSLSRVEIRYWDKGGSHPCTFEENWEKYCK